MSKFILRRIGLALITLLLLSVLVFIGTQLLPGDVGRRVLGPFADQEAVDALNARLGTDRPVLVQYWDWISSAATGDLGFSISYSRRSAELMGRALGNSAKLAALAFVIVVPLSLLGGIVAALRRGKLIDRDHHRRRVVGHGHPRVRLRDRLDPRVRGLAATGSRARPPLPRVRVLHPGATT